MRKFLSALLAGAMMAAMAVPAFAADSSLDSGPSGLTKVYNSDGEVISNDDDDVYGDVKYDYVKKGGSINIDGVVPGITMYIPLGDAMNYVVGDSDANISLESLTNDDYFKFDLDKDDGGSMVKKIEVVEDKRLGDLTRTSYLKIDLNDSTTTSDIKSNGTFTFKAKDSADDFKNASGSKRLNDDDQEWDEKEEIKMSYTFWINNDKASNDDNPDSGDRVYFDPDDNEDNTLIWGDDRAGLFFEANDDASKFYARLSTKSDSEIYSEYGDPVNADLWFFDFVGSATIPATSRATLTLGIPWDEDDDYTPNPEDCFIYEKDADGYLVDVTDKFTYDEDNDGTTEIEGWSIKTRTLGTYVISDTELDLDVAYDDVDEEDVDGDDDTTVDTGKEIPNTGSSDMVNVAVVAAAVSLAAAGAIAFKKVTK